MVAGNRGELFALDLSFIGWWLLTCITFGIASIYVVPYYFTTQALYYENFKLRALQEGKLLRMIFFRKSKERLNMLLQVLKTAIKTITITTIKAIITTILIIATIHKAVLKTKLHKIKMQLRFIPTIQTVYRQSKSLFKAAHIRLMRILTIQQPKTTAHQARK